MLARESSMAHHGLVPRRRPFDSDEGRHLEQVPVDGGHDARDGVEILQTRDTGWSGSLWAALPKRFRRTVAGLTAVALTLALGVTGLVQARRWLVEQDRRAVVTLVVSLGVWTSSTSPPGGYVTYFVTVRNGGPRTLEVTSLQASDDQLRLRSRATDPRRVDAGKEILLPVSALLTCSPGSQAGVDGLRVEVGVRREDGRRAQERVSMPAALIQDAAQTLCSVRPDLHDHELSGPVLATGPGAG